MSIVNFLIYTKPTICYLPIEKWLSFREGFYQASFSRQSWYVPWICLTGFPALLFTVAFLALLLGLAGRFIVLFGHFWLALLNIGFAVFFSDTYAVCIRFYPFCMPHLLAKFEPFGFGIYPVRLINLYYSYSG